MDCIFCAIAAGDIPSTRVHEDDQTLAFLDINPLARGHALVIPKVHGQRVADLPADSAAAVMQTVQHVTPRLCQAVGAVDATIAINDGPDAGQEVPHCHVHIIPRRPGDSGGPVHALFAERPTPDADDMAAIAAEVMV